MGTRIPAEFNEKDLCTDWDIWFGDICDNKIIECPECVAMVVNNQMIIMRYWSNCMIIYTPYCKLDYDTLSLIESCIYPDLSNYSSEIEIDKTIIDDHSVKYVFWWREENDPEGQ